MDSARLRNAVQEIDAEIAAMERRLAELHAARDAVWKLVPDTDPAVVNGATAPTVPSVTAPVVSGTVFGSRAPEVINWNGRP